MPETSVNEHRDLRPGQCDIRECQEAHVDAREIADRAGAAHGGARARRRCPAGHRLHLTSDGIVQGPRPPSPTVFETRPHSSRSSMKRRTVASLLHSSATVVIAYARHFSTNRSPHAELGEHPCIRKPGTLHNQTNRSAVRPPLSAVGAIVSGVARACSGCSLSRAIEHVQDLIGWGPVELGYRGT